MFDKDTWQEILSTIRKNKLRTALTALGVFWGIFMLVFILGLGKGLETGVFRNFGAGAKNVMYVWAWKTTIPYNGKAAGRRIRLNIDDVLAVQNEVAGVGGVSPTSYAGQREVNYGSLSGSFEVKGQYPANKAIDGLLLPEGRFINELDVADGRKVAVIGLETKKELFGDSTAVGEHIKISNIDFLVVGVFEIPDPNEWDIRRMKAIITPLTTIYKAFGVRLNSVNEFTVLADDGVAVSDIEADVRALLRVRHDVAPDDRNGIGGFNLEAEWKSVKNLFIGIKGLLWFVGIGTLFAGIIGVSNIMLITVKERTKEIGIRKALGATPSSIVSMILTESVFITGIAGYLGLMFGTFLVVAVNYGLTAAGIENQNFADPKVNLTIALSALIFLIVAGAVAGLIPALQAAKVNPVVALKDE